MNFPWSLRFRRRDIFGHSLLDFSSDIAYFAHLARRCARLGTREVVAKPLVISAMSLDLLNVISKGKPVMLHTDLLDDMMDLQEGDSEGQVASCHARKNFGRILVPEGQAAPLAPSL